MVANVFSITNPLWIFYLEIRKQAVLKAFNVRGVTEKPKE